MIRLPDPVRRRLAALALLPFAPSVRAQADFPSHVLTMMNPWPPGSPTDLISRRVAPLLAKQLGQPVIVNNLPGAGGTLAVGKVATSPPDGYTVLVGTPTELVLSPLTMSGVRYAPSDFRMFAVFGRLPYVLCGRKDLPARTVDELLALGLAKPLTYGHIGTGSLIHLITAQFAKLTGATLEPVPYKGVAPLVQDLLASQIDLAFLPMGQPVQGYLERGDLRGYGSSSARVYPLVPMWKPLAVQARSLERFDYDVWVGLQVLRTTPEPLVQRWQQAFQEATRDAEFRDWARANGTDLQPAMTLAELDGFYRAEIARYQALAKSIGVTG